ncbi:Beta-hexosaminidase [Purpureocillium lavendulum]|uniref:Beta-hexosaminidase n=1 Tax=Purpureocillium lavendulum TaxID=1247861 RepID=A0AB34FIJ7_9HYPO|nr:Beta-hexosaminidase [Purpureocillium lavendulum]
MQLTGLLLAILIITSGLDLAEANGNNPFSEFTSRVRDYPVKRKCRAVYSRVRESSSLTLAAGYTAWVAASETARPLGAGLMQVLNQPFWANAGGVAVAGMVSGAVLRASDYGKSNKDADVLKGVVAEAIKSNPGVDRLEVKVNGPTGEWTVTISATKPQTPPPPPPPPGSKGR